MLLELLRYFTSHPQFHVWENSMSWVIAKKALDQSTWNSNTSRISRGMRMMFCKKPQISWAWSGMASHNQMNWKLYIINTFKRQIFSSFFCILNLHKQRGHYLLLIFYYFGQHCTYESTIFLRIVSKENYCDTWLSKFHVWQNSRSWVNAQSALDIGSWRENYSSLTSALDFYEKQKRKWKRIRFFNKSSSFKLKSVSSIFIVDSNRPSICH